MTKILVIEDDPNSAAILQKLLAHERYEVITASDGMEALEKVDAERPDLVVLDIMMPGLDGFAVTRKLRGDPRFRDLPIIVVSAKGQSEDIAQGLDLGANDYLAKPIILEELLARVRTQLRLKDAQDRLRRANEELRKMSDIKGRLVTVVSHELRTPLTSIRGALELVLKRSRDALPANCLQLLDISIRNTDRLIRLVNDVLDFSRLEQQGQAMRMTRFQVEPLLRRAIDEVLALGEEDGIVVDIDIVTDLPDGLGDPERVHQVAINLLSNAIKFSESGGRVVVRALTEGERWIRVEVVDHGPGIPLEDIPKVFEPFRQLERPGRGGGGGTGLGLAISRDIVERCGGRMDVESAPGRGSTFSFTILRADDARMPSPSPAIMENQDGVESKW